MQKLSFTDNGSGFPIVLLHGFCESKEYWENFDKALSTEYRVICIDLPGFGKSKPVLHVSMESFAEEISLLLKTLSVNRFLLVGHSLGGYVALALAEHEPDMVLGLCLFHSSALADSEEKKMQRTKTIKYLDDNGVEAFIRPFVPPLFFPKNRKRCEAAINFLTEIGLKTTLESIKNTTAAMRDRPDRTHVLSEAQYPILFIIGKNDASIKLDDSLSQCHLPTHSYVQFLGDTAHQGVFEEPEKTLDMLFAFSKTVYKSR